MARERSPSPAWLRKSAFHFRPPFLLFSNAPRERLCDRRGDARDHGFQQVDKLSFYAFGGFEHLEVVSFVHGHLPKPAVVRYGHIVKTQDKPFVVRSGQRIDALQINMIANHHESSLTELAFDASRSIRQDDRFYSHAGEHADRENYLLGRISFIEMYAALHPGHRH